MNLVEKVKHLNRSRYLEPTFFIACIILLILPIFRMSDIASLDGQSHYYNAQIIKQLLAGNDVFENYFSLNNIIVPNWTGHFILGILSTFLEANEAVKALLLIFLISLPLSFRYLLKSFDNVSIFGVYFIFPLGYSYFFALGFYNYLLGLTVSFLVIGYWVRCRKKNINTSSITVLSLLFLLAYFTHLFSLFSSLICIGFLLTPYYIKYLATKAKSDNFGKALKNDFLTLAFSLIPSIILLSFYFLHTSSVERTYEFLPYDQLFNELTNLQFLISYGTEGEQIYTKSIFLLLTISTTIITYKWINKKIATKKYSFNDAWFLIIVFFLIVYFMGPNSDGEAGYFSFRYISFAYLAAAFWIGTQPLTRWFKLILSSLVIYNTYYLIDVKEESMSILSTDIQRITHVGTLIPENSVVLPFNINDNWTHGHFSNYLSFANQLVILENYECHRGYFPVVWDKSQDTKSLKDLFDYARIDLHHSLSIEYLNNLPNEVQYIFIDGSNRFEYQPEIEKIKTNYELIFDKENVLLFKLR